MFDHIGDAQKSSDFDDNFKQAQQKGWTTGYWGTASYYIDDSQNMYVGSGQLQGTLSQATDGKSTSLNLLDFTSSVQAPMDSRKLLSVSDNMDNSSLQSINGIKNLNTSQVKVMEEMFTNDSNLRSLNLSNWDTSQVKDIGHMFNNDKSLSELNISNLSNTSIPERYMVFNNTNIKDLTLNSNFQVRYDMGLSSTYKNGNQTLGASQLQDDSSHPGTWIKQ